MAWIHERDREGATLLVRTKKGHQFVGLVLLHESSVEGLEAELRLGYLLAESQWGKGYATELVTGVVDWARTRPYDSVIGGVDASNSASRRVLEKCGFVPMHDSTGEHLFYAIAL